MQQLGGKFIQLYMPVSIKKHQTIHDKSMVLTQRVSNLGYMTGVQGSDHLAGFW